MLGVNITLEYRGASEWGLNGLNGSSFEPTVSSWVFNVLISDFRGVVRSINMFIGVHFTIGSSCGLLDVGF